MKVIAKTNSGFLCEVSVDEYAQLHGVNSAASAEYKKLPTDIGTEVDLLRAIDILATVRNLDQSKLGYIARQLQHVLTQVEEAKTAAEGLNLLNTIKKA